MWLFCKQGFFSAVQHKDDEGLIHVRARFSGDLERLCRTYRVKTRIEYTPDGDYHYRADFSRVAWRRIVAAEAGGIDYTNFKNEVHDGTARDDAYFEVWNVLREAQEKDAEGNAAERR